VISSIHIENIALIDSLDLQPNNSMNVFTGETGAGKSIIIDSINLALGGRANRELIRTDKDSAFVSILLCDLSEAVCQKLLEFDIDITEDKQLLLQREIFCDGKNICKINLRPATTSLLKEIGSIVINIHGQHDSIGLIKTDRHISLLDTYAKLENEIKAYQQEYFEYKSIKKERDALTLDNKEKRKTNRIFKLLY
jgi:DNA repair protein RecN (Recombination protein N)